MPTPVDDGIIIDPGTQIGPPTTGTWFKGTIIVDATGTPYICTIAGTPGTWKPIGLGTIPPPDLVSQYPEFIDTFVNGVQAGMGWTLSNNGGGAGSTQIAPPAGKGGRNGVVGVIRATTGTSTTGRSGAILGANLMRFEGGNTYTLWCRFLAETLADNSQRYVFRVGFTDQNTGTDAVDGVYFEYDQGQSPNWRCKTASNNSRTTVTTTVGVQEANWIDLKIDVDASAQIARFYIDDVLVATINTNIPTSAGRETSVGYVIAKTVGGTARYVCLDRIYFKLNAA